MKNYNNLKKRMSMSLDIYLKDKKNIHATFAASISIGLTTYGLLTEEFSNWFPNLQLPLLIKLLLNNFLYYLFFLIICSLTYIFIKYFTKSTYEIIIDNEHKVVLAIGNFFDNLVLFKNANCVFGCNDSFNCDVNKLTHTSIHYKFMTTYFKNNYNTHQLLINDSLNGKYVTQDGTFENISSRHYDSGTIATVSFDVTIDSTTNTTESRQAFLVANSRLQSNEKSYKMINTQINYPSEVWNYIDQYGTLSDSLIFPLIGTSVNTGQLSKNTVALQIIDTYFDNLHKGDVKDLIISIPLNEYLDKKIDVLMLKEYIKSRNYLYTKNPMLFNIQTSLLGER